MLKYKLLFTVVVNKKVMAIVFPKTFRSSVGDLSWMASLTTHRDVVQQKGDIIWDFSNVRDFDENLCAALGVFLTIWRKAKRRVRPRWQSQELMATFKRNGFLKEFSLPRVAWYDGLFRLPPDRAIDEKEQKFEVVPFHKFERGDIEGQVAYISKLLSIPWWPKMSEAVKDAIADQILEVFSNACEHSESELGVFVCGNVCKVGSKIMRISIADAGIGFRKKIEDARGLVMSSSKAIAWGMAKNNTVRRGSPGGLGLKLLQEFISKNDGKLSVLSDRGFWELSAGREKVEELDFSFPGTVVTITVNAEDSKIYRMVTETDCATEC